MSAVVVRSILESALAAMSPALDTAWENALFTPVEGVAYQRANVLFATPRMMEQSQRLHREQGFLQINLCYPKDDGTQPAGARAEAIRATFYAGRPLTGSGITVTIDGTPEIAPAMSEEDRYVLPVRVRFYAHISRS